MCVCVYIYIYIYILLVYIHTYNMTLVTACSRSPVIVFCLITAHDCEGPFNGVGFFQTLDLEARGCGRARRRASPRPASAPSFCPEASAHAREEPNNMLYCTWERLQTEHSMLYIGTPTDRTSLVRDSHLQLVHRNTRGGRGRGRHLCICIYIYIERERYIYI